MVASKFILLIKDENKSITDALIKLFDEKGFGYWHWINNSWLLTKSSADVTPSSITNDIGKILPSSHFIVFQVKDDKWSGRGNVNAPKNMFTWIKETWDKN